MSADSERLALDALLDERNEHPERLGEIDAAIRARFEKTAAVFVLDMCGFSRLTLRHGILHFLAMIRRLHKVVAPVVDAHGGRVVKTEADNVFAVFPDVPDAVAAAIAVNDRLREGNAYWPEDWDLYVSIGIGYGPVLLIGPGDLFGHEMNLASKLGEDVAESGEVLLTDAAHARAVAAGVTATFAEREVPVSGMALRCHQLARR